MKVISIPTRLYFAAGLVLLSIPLAALQTVIMTRAPWWKLPYRSMEIWAGVAAVGSLPLAWRIVRGGRVAHFFLGGVLLTWCALTGWMAIRTKNPALGFFGLFLFTASSCLWFFIRYEMDRSFFDPKRRWFEGLPQSIPALKCLIVRDEGKQQEEFRIARIDSDGVFVFSDEPSSKGVGALRSGVSEELVFQFREKQIKCMGVPVRALDSNQGAGFRFTGMSHDARKDLGDFVEILRGEGYVQ